MKLIFTLTLTLACLVSKSQLYKDTWLLGGNLNYSKTVKSIYNLDKSRQIFLSSNIGYFLADKFCAGFKLEGQFGKDIYNQPDGTKTSFSQNNYGTGLFSRFYFLEIDNRLNILTEANCIYINAFQKSPNQNRTHYNEFGYELLGGIEAFFNSAVGIELLLGYNHHKLISSENGTGTIQLKIGFQFHLEKIDQ